MHDMDVGAADDPEAGRATLVKLRHVADPRGKPPRQLLQAGGREITDLLP